jgi:hypothetical protein
MVMTAHRRTGAGLLSVVVAAMTVACSGSGHRPAPSSAQPSTSPKMAATCRHLMRTWPGAANGVVARPAVGAHLRLRVGQTRPFRVVLYPGGGYTGWTPPRSDDSHRVGLRNVQDPLRGGVSHNCLIAGTLVARAPGTARISSGTDTPCFHDPVHTCYRPAYEWSVTVTVVSR